MSRLAGPDNQLAEKFTMPPDPGQADTLNDLVERLRLLKVWAGDPSYVRITDTINCAWRAAGRPAGELARKTTVVDCFRPGRRRLNTDLVVAVVQALYADVGYVAQWRQALRVIGGETEAASQVRVHGSLPQDLPLFTGRIPELDQLRQVLHHAQVEGGTVLISAIEGMAGVGKTHLAIHAAHLLMRQKAFDRVLFVNLRGFHPDRAQPPADPAAVLDGFLRLLGVPGQQIPHQTDARIAVYRHHLAGSRTLVVLDNAADTAQVSPLLPATPGCLTLVTSRRSLTDLHPATRLTVDTFDPQEAVAYLTHAVPKVAVGSDPHAPARIAHHCGYLPLALSLVAGHIRSTSGWTLTDHADRLDERHCHRRLDTGVELALDLSYQHLSTDQQRLLRLAALHPGQEFDVYGAASLTDTDLPTAHDHLDRLCRDHLLQQATAGRYSFHDLVRAYATDRATDEDPPPHRRAALTRLFDYYLATTAAAMQVAHPAERVSDLVIPPANTPTPDLADRNLAERWLDIELAALLASAQHAAEHRWPDHTWLLSAVLYRYLETRGGNLESVTLYQQSLALARQLGNYPAELDALRGLGNVHRRLGHHRQAGDCYTRALQIARDIGDRVGEWNALIGLGEVHMRLGRYQQAGDYYNRALQIARDIGDRDGECNALTGLGQVHRNLGRYEQASDHCAQAVHLARAAGDRVAEGYALTVLGHLHEMLDRQKQAASLFRQALQIAQSLGQRRSEPRALTGLGMVHLASGRHRQAADCFQQVLELARDLGSGNWQFEALQALGLLHHATAQPEMALIYHGQALQLAIDLAQPTDQARAHDGLAHAHHTLHQHHSARQHWQHALHILTRIGVDHTDEINTNTANIRARLTKLDQQRY